MIDDLGERMKSQYEIRTRTFLPRRTYTIIRLDGVAFHTYTKGLKRPFDEDLTADMNETAKFLCEKIQGVKFAYVQSDEISILLTDFEKNETDAWFDGEVQKIVSVSAAMATAKFNQLRTRRQIKKSIVEYSERENDIESQIKYRLDGLIETDVESLKLAFFDSRVYTIPDPIEVANYFIWRGTDCSRNSISMAAQSLYSHKELMGKNSSDKQEMIFKKGINWNDYPNRFKRGGFIYKMEKEFVRTESLGMTPLESISFESDLDKLRAIQKFSEQNKIIKRKTWECIDTPIFTKEAKFLYDKIPVIASDIVTLTEILTKTEKQNEKVI